MKSKLAGEEPIKTDPDGNAIEPGLKLESGQLDKLSPSSKRVIFYFKYHFFEQFKY